MDSFDKGGRVTRMWHARSRLTTILLISALLITTGLLGCDDPPEAPEPSVNIDEKQTELRQKIEQIQSDAKTRVDQVADQIPNGDAGVPDTAVPPEQ
jgi:hypothetical protein